MLGITGPGAERFNQVFPEFIVADIARELDISGVERPHLKDISFLLSLATRLALSPSDRDADGAIDCRLAYEIAVRAPVLIAEPSSAVASVVDVILARLGNFPAMELMKVVHPIKTINDPFLDFEVRLRERGNAINTNGGDIFLTDFQTRLLTALEKSRHVSVSAPTSAGKSFTLELELLKRLRETSQFTAVFLVPTRALIRQVSLDIADIVRKNDLKTLVLSSPVVPSPLQPQCIFVLTQERFATLLSEAPPHFILDALIVDEAQEIGEDSRGVTLERTIRIALSRFPGLRLFFSSPLRSNPEYLLDLFPISDEERTAFIEHESPVTQNLISIHPVDRRPTEARISITIEKDNFEMRTVTLPFRFRGNHIGLFAHHFTKREETSIIYCNRPSNAYKTARQISDLIKTEPENTDLSDFAKFLRTEIHREYNLADLVERGVAFHYANLPQIVRGRIEELVKDRAIQFVCCTSTLLQGMNLPAKNLFVEDPRTGQGEGSDMTAGDFWNLAGRAGRLTKEFTGNVFCIFGRPWARDLLREDKLTQLESAYQVAVTRNAGLLAFYAETPSTAPDGRQAWSEYALAGIYSDRVSTGTLLQPASTDEHLRGYVDRVNSVCTSLMKNKTLPDEVFTRNYYVHPQRLEDLAGHFNNCQDILDCLPVLPVRDSRSARLTEIFRVIEEVLLRSESQRYKYFGFLGTRWMSGIPLRELIADRLRFYNTPSEKPAINSEIGKLFEEVEKVLRYTYVKYSSIYCQVLAAVLRSKGLGAQADGIFPIHLFLEFGASNQTLINLMSLGLSRTSALLLKGAAALPDNLDAARCKTFISDVPLGTKDIPSVCRSEVARLRGYA